MSKHRAARSRPTLSWPRHRRPARFALVLAAAVAVLAGTGASALAYWHGGGAGTGAATTGTAVAVTLSPATPPPTLFPGGQAEVRLTVSNPNTTPMAIAALGLDAARGVGGFTVDTAHGGCATAGLSFTTQTNASAGWLVPPASVAGNGSLAITLPDALALSLGAANACQGAEFTVYLRVQS